MDKRRRRRSRERSPDVKKVKGRGVRHESGLRSWNDTCEKKKDPKTEAEPKVQPSTQDPENLTQSKIKQLEPEIRKRSKNSPVWIHDKFDKLNRSPESEGSEVSKVRESPTYMP